MIDEPKNRGSICLGNERECNGLDDHKTQWRRASENLISAIVSLGFPEELGKAVAKNLGGPKAMERMTSYLYQAKPGTAELIVDEMLGIMSEIEAWRNVKESREANAAYNEIMYHGLGEE